MSGGRGRLGRWMTKRTRMQKVRQNPRTGARETTFDGQTYHWRRRGKTGVHLRFAGVAATTQKTWMQATEE